MLRNTPPVRVYRLRFTPASPAAADSLAPAYRPSSVPLTRGMHIDSNGVAAAGIALGLAALARVARPSSKLWLLPALAAGPVAAFFRDPERDVPEDPTAVVASADGKVLSVQRLHDERFGDGEWLRIAVFLSVLDVHVNRAPVAGKVVDYFVADGGFVNAMKPDAEHNVAAYTVLDTARGTVVVAQRTGPDRPPDRAARADRRAAGQGRALRADPVRLADRRLPAGRGRGPAGRAGRQGGRRVHGHRPLALTRQRGTGRRCPRRPVTDC